MKKIILFLMILSSFVFASVGEQLLYDSTNNIYKGVTSGACYSKGAWFDWMRPSSSDAIYDYAMVNNGRSGIGVYASDGTYQMYSFSTVSCPVPVECNPLNGTFTNLDGTCTDCTPYLTDVDYTNMAKCACSSIGSTYNSAHTTSFFSKTDGGFTYSVASTYCDDGTKADVYYNKAPISDNNGTTPSDGNNTAPSDNNNTTPSDNNGTTPSDNNNTIPSDGNGTTPNDGNGTAPTGDTGGKDYSTYLSSIIEKLSHIDNGINGDVPFTEATNFIPTDTSAVKWDTYGDAWNNIIDGLKDVSKQVNNFKGLVNEGFNSPFLKSSPTTCLYKTSFDFYDLGTLPLEVDFCQVFSPLYRVFYVITYLFSFVALLLFSFKIFIRLV